MRLKLAQDPADGVSMTHVSRPLIALLIASVAALALWMVALKPGSGDGTSAQSLSTYGSAVAKAHQAVAASAAAGAADGAPAPTTPTTPTIPTAGTTPASTARAAVARARAQRTARTLLPQTRPPTALQRRAVVERALRAHRLIALLFYNGAAPDDQAVKAELAGVPASGHLFKLAIPISDLSLYAAVTDQVPVQTSPTLVIVGPRGRATTIVGYADPLEIEQRIANARAAG
ncbi:MAG: hypothetical protein ACYC91_11150 [Solirubrobacteraceae bacterium]